MKFKIFIDYLISYDSINIFKIWNLDKFEINDYRNVIFNENEFYDFYQKNDLMIVIEKNNLIEFHVYDSSSIVKNLDDVQTTWMQFPFKKKMKTQKIQKNQNNQNNMKQNETRTIKNRKKLISNFSFLNQLIIPKMTSQ